jgi:SecD/SecF fusion protein
MRNYGLIFGLLAALVVGSFLAINSFGLKLGIDLSGGTILVYQVKEGTQTSGNTMDELVSSLQKRVNPEGVADIPIRKVGNNRLEIILANAQVEEVDRLKRKITDVGALEFRILANQKKDGERGTNAVARALAPTGLARPPAGYYWARLGETLRGKEVRVLDGRTLRIPNQVWTRDRYKGTEIALTGKDSAGADASRSIPIESNTADTLTLARPHGLTAITGFTLDYNPSEIGQADMARGDAVIRDQEVSPERTERYILIRQDRYNVTGDFLARAYPTQDERVQPAVGFVFNSQGARKFGGLTGSHLPEEGGAFKYRLAVLLDGLVRSAPSINSRITDSGIIEGVQPEEVNYLIEILRAGSLPASIDPTPLLEEKIGPTLGRDTIEKGLYAIGVSMFIVPLFMILVYRFAGVIAVVCLLLNMLLLVASMALTGSSFTLPGLAGLALTIGMAVDANVLIFERMREEQEKGAGVAQQIRNGFDRAWTTIFDSNITTVLSGLILWFVGTQEVKGFALTLIIGLLWNLFTAVWVSRVIFDFVYSRGLLKSIKFNKILGRTNFDFIGKRRTFMAVSALAIAIGLGAFFLRGKNIYNIDFTGGTLVTVQLDPAAKNLSGDSEAARAAFVRSTAGKVLPDVSVETLNITGEQAGTRFNVRTTDDDVRDVQEKILKAFGPALAQVGTTVGAPVAIPGAAAPAATTPDAAKKDAPAATPAVAARFAGGREYPLTFSRPVQPATVQAQLNRILAAAKVTTPDARYELVAPAQATQAGSKAMTLRTDLEPEVASQALATLGANLKADPSLLFDRLENFGGAVAGETRTVAALAIVLSWLVIIAYLWFRFKSFAFGLAAVIALVHDVLITLGAVALSPYKIDLPMVAAFLTLIGFSVNDTIVIFDRIRELRGKTAYLSPQVINDAINQTLSRTLLTSATAWLVVFIMYLFGGEGLRGFSFALVIGFLSGIYSTVYIAAPILIEWLNRERVEAPGKAKPALAAREA